MKFGFKGQKGFSIIELMVVVGIIGVLAAVGLPKMQIFLAKSKRAEAKMTLSAYKTMQEGYYVDGNGYGNNSQIGFTNMNQVYTFASTSNATTYSATMTAALGRLCSNSPIEVWTVNQLTTDVVPDNAAKNALNCN